MKPSQGSVVVVTEKALQNMRKAGRRALPRETGGIVLGFRLDDQVVITRALLVPDLASTGHEYELRTAAATAQLLVVRAQLPEVVGYVGDWHTHPADVPPSRTDIASLKAAARKATDVLALLVVSFRGAEAANVYARLGRRSADRRFWRPTKITISTPTLEITPSTSADLEHRAHASWREGPET